MVISFYKILRWDFMKKKFDFLPNRQNKYSIRRMSVGTTSILLGATLIFGIVNHEADAEENNTTNEISFNNANKTSESGKSNVQLKHGGESEVANVSRKVMSNELKVENSEVKEEVPTENSEVREEAPVEKNDVRDKRSANEIPNEVPKEQPEYNDKIISEKNEETNLKKQPNTRNNENEENRLTKEIKNKQFNVEQLKPKKATIPQNTKRNEKIVNDFYIENNIEKNDQKKLNKYLPENIYDLSSEEVKKQILALALRYNILKEKTKPIATARSTERADSSTKPRKSLNSKITGNDVTNQVDFTNTTISVKNNKIRPIDAESFKSWQYKRTNN